MRNIKGAGPIAILLDNDVRVGPRVANAVIDGQKVRIDNPIVILLKKSIVKLEDLSANQFIISVHDHEDLLGFALLIGRMSQIDHGSLSLFVKN